MQTTIAFGYFAGPIVQGYVTQHMGFPLTFATLAIIAAAGAVVFLTFMPETKIMDEKYS
jgi:MFS family permease